MTKEEYLNTVKSNKDRACAAAHRGYTDVVERFLHRLEKNLAEGDSHVFFDYQARGGEVDGIIYSPKIEECLIKAKELYPWLDIKVNYKERGDFSGTLKVLYD